jgi:hypothetical protein
MGEALGGRNKGCPCGEDMDAQKNAHLRVLEPPRHRKQTWKNRKKRSEQRGFPPVPYCRPFTLRVEALEVLVKDGVLG